MVRPIQPSMKPTAPLRGGWHSRLKPTTPMHGSDRPKQAHSHPQRRHRFHNPHQPHPQRQHRFHQRPTNTTDLPTTRPHTAQHETHNTNARRLALALETRDTNARRPTLALETRDTNARLQPPKTGPFTPGKGDAGFTTPTDQTRKGDTGFTSEPTSLSPRTTPGTKPSFFHRFRSPSARSRDVSSQVSVFHARFTLTAPSGHGHRKHHRAHGHATLPTECRQVSDRADGRSVRVGGARREEWGHGR